MRYLLPLFFAVCLWIVCNKQQIDVWYDEDYVYNNNEMIKWYDSYKARRVFYLSPGILMVWWTGVCQKTRRGDGSNR